MYIILKEVNVEEDHEYDVEEQVDVSNQEVEEVKGDANQGQVVFING